MGTSRRSVLMHEMTWPEYADRIAETIVILPVASTEQHGPHLPLGTDTFQVNHAATRVAEELDGIVAPCITYGYRSAPKSGGGEIFKGTTSVSAVTLIHLVKDVLKAFIRHGATRVVVLDGHYENGPLLHEAIHLALEESRRDDVRIIRMIWAEAITPRAIEKAFPHGFPGWALEHAAHFETSVMRALHPDLVLTAEIRPDGAKDLPPYDIYPQPLDFVPKSGVLADPSRATAAIGHMILDDCIGQLVTAIRGAFPNHGN